MSSFLLAFVRLRKTVLCRWRVIQYLLYDYIFTENEQKSNKNNKSVTFNELVSE